MNRIFPATSHLAQATVLQIAKYKHTRRAREGVQFDSHSHIDLLRTNCATGNVNFDLTCSMSHIHGVCLYSLHTEEIFHSRQETNSNHEAIYHSFRNTQKAKYTSFGRCDGAAASVVARSILLSHASNTLSMAIKN